MLTNAPLSQQSITHYGKPTQILKAIEELLELSIELSCCIDGNTQDGTLSHEYRLLLLRRKLNASLKLVRDGANITINDDMSSDDWLKVLEEVADVYIILEHVVNISGMREQLQGIVAYKETRLKRQIAQDEREVQCKEAKTRVKIHYQK